MIQINHTFLFKSESNSFYSDVLDMDTLVSSGMVTARGREPEADE
jgi:hypothetical protein